MQYKITKIQNRSFDIKPLRTRQIYFNRIGEGLTIKNDSLEEV